MSEKLPRSAKLLLAVSGGLGVLVAIQGAVMAIKDFFWFHFLINLLYFACFTLIFIYASHRPFPSKVLFPLVNCLYGAIVLCTGIIFPQRGLPIAVEAAESFLSLLVIIGLICHSSTWSQVSSTKKWFTLIVAAEVLVALQGTWNVFYECPMHASLYTALVQVWLRPAFAALLAFCYSSRMKQKYGA